MGLYCFYGKFPKIVFGCHFKICILSLSYSNNKLSNYIVKLTTTSPNVIKKQLMYLPEVNERNTGNINPVLHVITLYQVFISAQTFLKVQRFVGRFVSDKQYL